MGRSPSIPVLLSLLALLIGAGLWKTPALWRSNSTGDYYCFWLPARLLKIHNVENIYSPEEKTRLFSIGLDWARKSGSHRHRIDSEKTKNRKILVAATPTFLWFFSLISSENYEGSYEIFRIASALVFIAGIILLGKSLGYPLYVSMLIAFGSSFFWALRKDMAGGNVSQLQMGLLSLYIFCVDQKFKWKETVCGFILGMIFFF